MTARDAIPVWEPLPCPFCGTAATVRGTLSEPHEHFYFECGGCGLNHDQGAPTPTAAVAAWNTRAAPSRPATASGAGELATWLRREADSVDGRGPSDTQQVAYGRKARRAADQLDALTAEVGQLTADYEEQRLAANKAIFEGYELNDMWHAERRRAEKAEAALASSRAAAVEECAKVAEAEVPRWNEVSGNPARRVAAAIRATAPAPAQPASPSAEGAGLPSIRLHTRQRSPGGQYIIVSVTFDDGPEVDVIRSFGALPDVEISHTVTPGGIRAELAKAGAQIIAPTHRHKARGTTVTLVGFGRWWSKVWDEHGLVGERAREVATLRAADGSLVTVPREEFEAQYEGVK